MFHAEAIMTLLQKIYLAVAVILFLLGAGGTVALGMYVLDDCASPSECTGLKVLLAFCSVAVILTGAYCGRVAWGIYKKKQPRYNYYDPLLGAVHENERIYVV